jgi:tetratricopeptide (TPR) repeat protein
MTPMRQETAQADVEVQFNLANSLRQQGRLEEAVSRYNEALRINPGHVLARHNLGNAFLALGRFDDAEASYRCVLEHNPNIPETHCNMGNALLAQRRPDEAVASYRHALHLNPQLAIAHSNLGDALRDLGRPEEAAASCREALALDPHRAETHNTLGNALLDLGRLPDAAASYARALSLNPRFVKAYVNLAIVLRLLGNAAEAEAMCRQALQVDPAAAAAVALLAELQADSGRFAEAETLFKRAAELDPNMPEAWAGIAHLRKMTPDDAPWLAQALRIADGALAPRQEAYLRYALGKYCDDLGDYDRAFSHYLRANNLTKLYGSPHDRQQFTHDVDHLTRTYDRAWARRPRDLAMQSTRPVFIVGMPRSGTSLAEQILASHPSVFGAGELPFWTDAAAAYEAATGEDRQNLAGAFGKAYLRRLDELSTGALRVVDKMPANFLHLGLIHDALPNARIIHLQRNPRDTCLSIYFQHFKTGLAYANDLEDLTSYYLEYLRLMKHWRKVLPASALLDVPYEGLVATQENESRGMLEFVGLPWDAACLDFHRTERKVMTASKWQVRQKISSASVGRWRHYQKFIGPLGRLAD